MVLIALSVVFICLWFYFRARKRENLEAQWRTKSDPAQSREAFVSDGLAVYDPLLKRWLILGVYVVPSALIAAFIYLTNNA